MDNPTKVTPINNKLQLSSSANVPLGAGVKVFQVNPEPKAQISTHDTVLTSTGAKYCTAAQGTQIALNAFTVLTNATAKTYEVFSNTAGVVVTLRLTGVSASNNEQTENITTSGVTAVTTANTYKFINQVTPVGGINLTTQEVYVRPSGATPQDQRIMISGVYVNNWGFMCCNDSSGRARNARLRSINSLYNTSATTNLALHVFENNLTTGASLGVYRPAYRLYDTGVVTTQGITFPDDGAVELTPGQLAVWYRESGTTIVTAISFSFSYYYTS